MTARLNLFFAAGFLWLAAMTSGGAVHAANFTASLDRDTITLGEQATLSLKFEDVQPKDAPTIPDIAGLRFQYVGPSSAFSFVNGQTTSSITYNYVVTAQRTGEFTIPALRANVGGQQLDSASLKLIVSKASAPTADAVNSGNEVAFMKLSLPKQIFFVGQSFVAELQLYLREDVQNFGNFQITSAPTDGFNAGKTVELQNQRRHVQVGPHVYTEIPLAIPLTALKTGALTLGPFTASCVVVLPSRDRGGDPFSQFFNQGEQHQLTLTTETAGIQSLPLPTENIPPNFNGVIGDYTLAVFVGPTNVIVGDPITVRVQITGAGDFEAIKLPDQSGWNGFKLLPPTSKIETSDQVGIKGTKTFEEIVTPQNSDIREVPPVSFSFFNPDDGKYHILNQPAVPLVVKSAGASPLPPIAANNNTTAENQTPQDIAPVKDSLGTLVTKSSPLVTRPVFLAVQTVPMLAFLAAFVWRKRADSLANNPRLRRKIAVEKMVQNGIADLRKHAAENNSEEFFAALFRLLQEQLGERLDCPASAITENVIEEHTILRGTDPATLDALRELFQLCNQARYAPVRGSSELNSVATLFEKTVGELQEVKA